MLGLFASGSNADNKLEKLEREVNQLKVELKEHKLAFDAFQSQVYPAQPLQPSKKGSPPFEFSPQIHAGAIPHDSDRVLTVQTHASSNWVATSAFTRPKGLVMPSLPGTPGQLHNRHDEAFDNLSLYSQATTTASQPAAYLDRAKARKLGGFQSWGAQGDAMNAAASQHPPPCEGVLGLEHLAHVRETVGQDMQPWLHALMHGPINMQAVDSTLKAEQPVSPSATIRTSKSVASTAVSSGYRKQPAGEAQGVDLDTRRQTRDQVSASVALLSPPSGDGDATGVTVVAVNGSPGASPTRVAGPDATQQSQQMLGAVALLAACEADEGARTQLCEAGALPAVLKLLRDSPSGSKPRRVAAHLLWYVSRSPAISTALDEPAAVGELLIQVLASREHDDAYTTRACALALNNLSSEHDGIRVGAASKGAACVLVGLLSSGDIVGAEAAAAALLGLTSGEDPGASPGADAVCAQLVEMPEGLEACLSMLRYGDPPVQDSLAGVMQNLTSSVVGQRHQNERLVASHCIPTLLEVARGGGHTAQEGAVSALGNLATDDKACHEALVAGGSIEILSFFISQPLPTGPSALAAARVQASAMLCLRNICTGNLATRRAVVERGGAAACLSAARAAGGTWAAADGQESAGADEDPSDPEREELDEHEAELQSWALAALLSLSTEPQLREAIVEQCRAAPPLLGVLLGGAPQAKELAAKVLTNLAIPDSCKTLLVAQGAAMVLVPLVRTGTRAGRQAACRALYNLSKVGANRAEIAACGGVSALLEAVVDGESSVFEAAAAALHGLCNHLQVMEQLVSAGASKALLSVVRNRHFTVNSRGSRLLLRLLQRMALVCPHVQEEIAAEAAALGLF